MRKSITQVLTALAMILCLSQVSARITSPSPTNYEISKEKTTTEVICSKKQLSNSSAEEAKTMMVIVEHIFPSDERRITTTVNGQIIPYLTGRLDHSGYDFDSYKAAEGQILKLDIPLSGKGELSHIARGTINDLSCRFFLVK